jgi:hypothetical protein
MTCGTNVMSLNFNFLQSVTRTWCHWEVSKVQQT